MSAVAGRSVYRPDARYADTLPETVAFIEERLAGGDWRETYPKMFQAYGDLFDYAAEDAWAGTVAERRGGDRPDRLPPPCVPAAGLRLGRGGVLKSRHCCPPCLSRSASPRR
ncbi:hypothetical protein STENM36S_07920 [Streptomyces tendae]